MKPWRRLLLPLWAACMVLPAAAQSPSRRPEPQPLWELGAGVLAVSQQAYPGAAERVGRGLVFPYLIYRGDLLRADREGIGLRAFKSERVTLDIGFAGAFGSNSRDIEARRGMPDLGTLVEFGPRLRWHLGPVPGGLLSADFALRGVFDLSDSMRHKGISLEPRLLLERRAGAWRQSVSAGVLLGNRHLADTFYGVAPAYANAGRPAYAAEAGLVAWRLGATLSRELSPRWRVFGGARFDSVAGAANRDSPLVQRTNAASVAVGLIFTWARSDTLVSE